jgi:hypothetical protein
VKSEFKILKCLLRNKIFWFIIVIVCSFIKACIYQSNRNSNWLNILLNRRICLLLVFLLLFLLLLLLLLLVFNLFLLFNLCYCNFFLFNNSRDSNFWFFNLLLCSWLSPISSFHQLLFKIDKEGTYNVPWSFPKLCLLLVFLVFY